MVTLEEVKQKDLLCHYLSPFYLFLFERDFFDVFSQSVEFHFEAGSLDRNTERHIRISHKL